MIDPDAELESDKRSETDDVKVREKEPVSESDHDIVWVGDADRLNDSVDVGGSGLSDLL